MPCKSELNSQLKGLQARISQAENDINSHYAGISQLVLSLSANPFTSASAAASAVIYNLNPIGMKILRALLNALIPKELQNAMRMLTLLSAASIDDLAEGIVDSVSAQAVGMVNQGIDSLTHSALMELTSINNELDSIIPGTIDALTGTLNQFSVSNDRTTSVSIMNQALTAYNDALAAPLGTFTQEQINQLHVAFLEAKKVVYSIDAGVAGVLAGAAGLLSGVGPTVQEINSALKEFNSIAAFILAQNDISSCKSVEMRIGEST